MVEAYPFTIAIASLAAAGVYTLARYRSLFRMLVGFEMLAAAAAAAIILWAGSIGFYAAVVVLDTVSAAVFASIAYNVAKEHGIVSADEA